jgi:hypothetical protein
MDSLIVTYPEKYGSERFRVLRRYGYRLPWGAVQEFATIMALDGYKVSVPYASLVPVNKQRNNA